MRNTAIITIDSIEFESAERVIVNFVINSRVVDRPVTFTQSVHLPDGHIGVSYNSIVDRAMESLIHLLKMVISDLEDSQKIHRNPSDE